MLLPTSRLRQSPSGPFLEVPTSDDFGYFAFDSLGQPEWTSGASFQKFTPNGGAFSAQAFSGANWEIDAVTGTITYVGRRQLLVMYQSVITLIGSLPLARNGGTWQLSKNDAGVGTFDFDMFSNMDCGSAAGGVNMDNVGVVTVRSPVSVEAGDTLDVIAYIYNPPNPITAFEWNTSLTPLMVL